MTTTSLPPDHRWREIPHPKYTFRLVRFTGTFESCVTSVPDVWETLEFLEPEHIDVYAALKANPTEPIPEPPVERDARWHNVHRQVHHVWNVARGETGAEWFGLEETTNRIVRLLRQPALTMQDHVDALVGMGAEIETWNGGRWEYNTRRVLILPTPEGA